MHFCLHAGKWLDLWEQHRSDSKVSPVWLKTEWVSPGVEAPSMPWLLQPPLRVSPLRVSTSSRCWGFWMLWVVVEGAARPWAGLRRPRPGAGAAAVAVGADGAVWFAWSRVGLFRKASRLGLLRAWGKSRTDVRIEDVWNSGLREKKTLVKR